MTFGFKRLKQAIGIGAPSTVLRPLNPKDAYQLWADNYPPMAHNAHCRCPRGDSWRRTFWSICEGSESMRGDREAAGRAIGATALRSPLALDNGAGLK